MTELGIAQKYGVSQGPVREAFARLRQEGYPLSLPNRGSFVSAISLDEARHVYEVRLLIEPYAAGLAFAPDRR